MAQLKFSYFILNIFVYLYLHTMFSYTESIYTSLIYKAFIKKLKIIWFIMFIIKTI
jgi:hypothetical protein